MAGQFVVGWIVAKQKRQNKVRCQSLALIMVAILVAAYADVVYAIWASRGAQP